MGIDAGSSWQHPPVTPVPSWVLLSQDPAPQCLPEWACLCAMHFPLHQEDLPHQLQWMLPSLAPLNTMQTVHESTCHISLYLPGEQGPQVHRWAPFPYAFQAAQALFGLWNARMHGWNLKVRGMPFQSVRLIFSPQKRDAPLRRGKDPAQPCSHDPGETQTSQQLDALSHMRKTHIFRKDWSDAASDCTEACRHLQKQEGDREPEAHPP